MRLLDRALDAYGVTRDEHGWLRDSEGLPLGVHVRKAGGRFWFQGVSTGDCGPRLHELLAFMSRTFNWRLR